MRFATLILLVLTGCAISNHGVFPKPVWYWSTDAQLQREYDKQAKERRKAYEQSLKDNPQKEP